MARQKTPTLTGAELRIMKVIWKLQSASVNDILSALPQDKRLAYNTILTMVRILEQKGYLRREKDGRAHIYRPLMSQAEARQQAVRHMVMSFFEDSPEQLVLSVLENESLSSDEIGRLKKMIEGRK